jgi:hypothetical protein
VAAPATLDPLRLRSHDLSFGELNELREYLEAVLATSQPSLEHFQEPHLKGFVHQDGLKIDPDDPFSKASTATCVAFLDDAGILHDVVPPEAWGPLRDKMVDGETVKGVPEQWTSAGLPADNPFTVSFLLDAIRILGGWEGLSDHRKELVKHKLDALERQLAKGKGLSILEYDATAFLTHKAYRVLKLWRKPRKKTTAAVRDWTWDHLSVESMLIASNSPDADVFELAYSVLTATAAVELNEMSPRERWMLHFALDQFFDHQRDQDGLWPRSRPLFLYPDLGFAYCFDYELLTSMLGDRQLAPAISARLKELRKAAISLDDRRFPLEPGRGGEAATVNGWSSGHHGRKRKAESWSTASVFHFCLGLDRLIAEAIRRDVFDYAGASYKPPLIEVESDGALPASFLDSDVRYAEGQSRSLTEVVNKRLLKPLLAGRSAVAHGRKLPEKALVSAIFYGPPGTAKTQLAEMISDVLGWPLLKLDPSHLTRQGLDRVHAEANELFGRLGACEEIVVLLDEFDELVREREVTGEYQSRFLTTAMLPKLQGLSNRRRLVYLIATNHPEQFDAAIRRPGRFDIVLPVMPPTLAAKRKKWPALADGLDLLEGEPRTKADDVASDLTFAETEDLVAYLAHLGGDPKAIEDLMASAAVNATVLMPVSTKENAPTWKKRMDLEQSKIRVRGYNLANAP